MTPKKILELTAINAGYDTSLILEEINLPVYENDFLGIIGPNGSGKTTLLRIILGLVPPQKGSVTFYDKHLQGNRKAIGYLPQFKIVDRTFPITVRDVILSGCMGERSFMRSFSRDCHERAESLMDRFGISHLAERTVGDLSGGEMQRVFLCRALISSPRLLILDEPDTFVDSSFAENLNEILVELNKDMAIILVSHDIGSIISAVKNIACVNGTLHYHGASEISQELLETYNCPVRLLGHGDIPHTILKTHGDHK